MLEQTWESRSGSQKGVACALTCLALMLAAGNTQPAHAQGQTPTPDAATPGAGSQGAAASPQSGALPSESPLPSCLDRTLADELAETLRPRGVQKREFLKNKHFQLVGHGGVFAADLLSSSYLYGGSLSFFFTEDFAVEFRFDVTPVSLDLDAPLAEFFGDDRFEPGTGYLGLASFVWSPIHAKLKIGDSILHSDIMAVAGAGRLFHDSVQGVTFNAGLMLELFTTQWVTFRFDIRDVIAVQEAVAETRLTNNIIATLGLSVWIPTGF